MNSSPLLAALAAAALLAALVAPAGRAGAADAVIDPDRCTGQRSAEMTDLFAEGVGVIEGADYQRAFALSDGRVLWVFQDAFVADGRGEPTLVHNAGAIESAGCFTPLVGGTPERPEPWVAASETVAFERWYWPLGGTQLDDHTFRLYLAEMTEPGEHYLAEAAPRATATVDVDLTTLTGSAPAPAPDPSAALYGWSIVEESGYRYLYGYCYHQFGASPIGHDPCNAEVRVARQPVRKPDAALAYWDGAAWVPDPAAAVNVAPTVGPFGETRTINPMQVLPAGDGSYVAVTKVGDWWGDSVYLDVAPAPEGPWSTSAVLPTAKLDDAAGDTNTYFATLVPTGGLGRRMAISNNCWSAPGCDAYRPTFRTLPARLWRPHAAVPVTDRTALPLGAPTAGAR